MKLQNEIFKGIEYTLVDIYELDNTPIYYFLSDDDELFCTKSVQGEYEIIKNTEKIDMIKEKFGIIMTGILFYSKFLEKINGAFSAASFFLQSFFYVFKLPQN